MKRGGLAHKIAFPVKFSPQTENFFFYRKLLAEFSSIDSPETAQLVG